MATFFKARDTQEAGHESRHVFNVGGKYDCGFRAVAAGIIDNFTTHSSVNKKLIHEILTRHFSYYPQHRPTINPGRLVTSVDLMNEVIRTVPLPQLIQGLAFTLRQLAVDEACKHPQQYPGIFADINEGTNPAVMRQSGTLIDESVVLALAHAIQAPIIVQVTMQAPSIPASTCYNAEQTSPTNPVIVIDFDKAEAHYRPVVINVALFRDNVFAIDPNLNPVITHEDAADDEDIERIIALIKAEEARVQEEFKIIVSRLTTMVAAGELNKDDLLNLYTKGMSGSTYLVGRIAHVDAERGEGFFSEAIKAYETNKAHQVQYPIDASHDEYIVFELVHALSRAISTGQLSPDEIFEQMDSPRRPA